MGCTSENHITIVVSGSSDRAVVSTADHTSSAGVSCTIDPIPIPQGLSTPVDNPFGGKGSHPTIAGVRRARGKASGTIARCFSTLHAGTGVLTHFLLSTPVGSDDARILHTAGEPPGRPHP